MKTALERIEARVGKVTSYEGQFCIWVGGVPHDIRDVLPKGVTIADATDALVEHDAEASKVRKAAARAAKENAE